MNWRLIDSLTLFLMLAGGLELGLIGFFGFSPGELAVQQLEDGRL